MEKGRVEEKIGNNRTHVPAERTRLQQVAETIGTSGLSLLRESDIPSDDDLRAIEHESFDTFNPELVESCIDDLQSQGAEGAKQAALLRGSFNGLIDRLNFHEATRRD